MELFIGLLSVIAVAIYIFKDRIFAPKSSDTDTNNEIWSDWVQQAQSEKNEQSNINKIKYQTAAKSANEISKAVMQLFPIVQCPRCDDIKWTVEEFNSQFTSIECKCVSCNKKMWFKANVGLDVEHINLLKASWLVNEKSSGITGINILTKDIVPIIIETSIQDIVSNDTKRHSIPTSVKREVWQRDQGRCTKCNSQENLEYDHIIPISKGGANTTRNIQLLCEKCNRQKSDKIE